MDKENLTYKFAIGFTFTNVSPVHHPFKSDKGMVLGARTIGLDRNELNVGFKTASYQKAHSSLWFLLQGEDDDDETKTCRW
jgi:hypothetical protein